MRGLNGASKAPPPKPSAHGDGTAGVDVRGDGEPPAEVGARTPQAEASALVAPPRTFLVLDSLGVTGALKVNLELARRWTPAHARIAVVQPPPSPAEAVPSAGVRIEHLTDGSTRLRWGMVSAISRLVALSRESGVVLSGSEIGVGLLAGYLAARIARRPFVIAVHADLDQALQEWMPARLHRLFYWVHRHADGAICVAHGLEQPLIRNGLASDRIRAVQNGIDLEAIRRRAQDPGNLVTGDVPVVVATGRLAPQKGYDLLLRAHAEVVGRFPHRVLILHDGPERASLGVLADQLGVSGSVQFAGFVSSPLSSVARADLFCLPSRHEGLPLALLEAIVLGVPIIAADCSEGVRTALDDGRIGDLVPPDNVPALARALEAYLADGTALREKARRGPEYARRFDSQAMADGWARALRDLVGSGANA